MNVHIAVENDRDGDGDDVGDDVGLGDGILDLVGEGDFEAVGQFE